MTSSFPTLTGWQIKLPTDIGEGWLDYSWSWEVQRKTNPILNTALPAKQPEELE